MTFSEVPSECRGGDRLSVDVGVFVKRGAVGGARQQQPEHAPLKVERSKREEPGVHLRRLLRGEEAFELLAEERGSPFEPRELPLAATTKQPGIPRPVSGVVAHREQEGDLRGDEVADERNDEQDDHEIDRERHRPDREEAHRRVGGEEEERRVDAEDVPFEDGRDREIAEDEPVEQQHEGHADVEQRPVVGNEEQGQRRRELEERAGVCHRLRQARRPQVVGVRHEKPPPQPGALQQRIVGRHDRHDVSERDGQLRDAGPEPDGELYPFAGGDPVPGEQEADNHREMVLEAPGESDRPVAEGAERKQSDDRDEMAGGDRRLDERTQQRDDERRVERDVEHRPGIPAEQRQAADQRKLRRAGAQEVQERGERRPHSQPERSAHAAESHHLDEARPQKRLLKCGPVEDPRPEVAERAEPGREAAEEHPAEDEQRQLHRVEQVRGKRVSETLQHVEVRADADALREILLRPLVGIELCEWFRDHGVTSRAHRVRSSTRV